MKAVCQTKVLLPVHLTTCRTQDVKPDALPPSTLITLTSERFINVALLRLSINIARQSDPGNNYVSLQIVVVVLYINLIPRKQCWDSDTELWRTLTITLCEWSREITLNYHPALMTNLHNCKSMSQIWFSDVDCRFLCGMLAWFRLKTHSPCFFRSFDHDDYKTLLQGSRQVANKTNDSLSQKKK